MIKAYLKRLISDYLAFAKSLGINKIVIIIFYMDNFLFFGSNLIEINFVKSFSTNQYKMKDLNSCRKFTKIKLEQNLEAKTISKSQRIYIQKALEHANMLNLKLVLFFLVFRINFSKHIKKPFDKDFIRLYQSHIRIYMRAYVYLQYLYLPNSWQILFLST